MGNFQSDNKYLEDSTEEEFREKCKLNRTDNKILFGIFKKEFNVLCNKWNDGILKGSDFRRCTIVTTYIKDDNFLLVFNDFIDKWNKGDVQGRDFNLISKYVFNNLTIYKNL